MENYDGLQFEEIKQQISECCCFSGGKAIIMEAYPQFHKLPVKLALDRTRQALGLTVRYGSMPFGGVYDVSNQVMLAMKDATLLPDDLLRIAQQAYSIDAIQKYVKSAEGEKNCIEDLTNSLEAMDRTATSIFKCINPSGEVNDNASVALSKIRKQKKQSQLKIASGLSQYMRTHSSWLQDDIIATRNDRSVVLIKNNFKNTVNGLHYGSSASGQATYVEPAEIIPLNNELQNCIEDERREVQRILHHLSQEVKKDGDRYLANINTLSLLDSIFAKAVWARKHDAVVAEINEDMNLIIEKGRHPLIDPKKVVANSYHIIDPVRTILITGPNTGGKTVSLKLIGLFTVMHLSGMALPCREASIPIYDNVFYDIGDNQSIAEDLSTFSAHIKKLSAICNEATNRSLVILDELGSGTDPVEGQALASAVLDYFRQKQIYTVATTHYSKLKAYGQQYDDIMLARVEFDQINLRPTYRYLENTMGESNALETAARYGMQEEIIEKARWFKSIQQQPEDDLLEKLQKQLELVGQEKEKYEELLKEAEEKKQEVIKEKEKLDADRITILEEARQRAWITVQNAEEEAEEIINELKQQKNYDMAQVARLKHALSQVAEEPEDEEETVEDDRPLQVGDWVKIAMTNQSGEIIAIDKKNATVLCSGTKIRVSVGNITRAVKPQPKKVVSTRTKVTRSSSFRIECNLIGMRVDEALPILDKFMDEALLANAPFVRIVHGIGTGTLRKAVWDKLKKYKFVKKYEYADSANGGSGATIVTLREG